MTEPSSPATALRWIAKRDGRLVPFDPDKISRALFRVTEELGRPDAFLAHELTDGILHFLAAEIEDGTPTTAQVADIVAKVVRELGQPALAHAFAQFPARAVKETPPASPPAAAPSEQEIGVTWSEVVHAVETTPARGGPRRRLAEAGLRTYSLRSVFTPDLVAAHREGLLWLGNLETPLELASAVLTPAEGTVVEQIVRASESVGDRLAIDGPEHGLARGESSPTATANYGRELRIGLECTGLNAVVNLNSAVPPVWAEQLAEGPLFSDKPASGDPARQTAIADVLLDELLADRPGDSASPRVDWHLSERDFLPENTARLQRLVRRALEGAALAFVFDRPRRRVALAEGLDRNHSATLLTVGLNLPRLAERRKVGDDRAEFLQKLGSLVRMALSAGCQKRDFLRHRAERHPALAQGFLLDRARVVLAPVGLDRMARDLAKCGLAGGSTGAEFGREVVRRIRVVVRQDSQSRHLSACLDGPAVFSVTGGPPSSVAEVAGLTAWDAEAAPKQQLRAAGLLHGAAEGGTAALLVPAEIPPTADEGTAWLRHAWQKTEITRLRFLRGPLPARQQTAPWAP